MCNLHISTKIERYFSVFGDELARYHKTVAFKAKQTKDLQKKKRKRIKKA
jgi:hypothetical protein